jgi:hypothetical protein
MEIDDPEEVPAGAKASSRRLLAIGLVAGVTAGLLSWLGGEAVYGLFAPRSELLNSANFARSGELAREQAAAMIKNATIAFGLLGGVLGIVSGAAGGVARRSARAGAMAGTLGLLAGALVGVGLSLALVPLAARDLVMVSENLGFALLIHGGIWSALGGVGGLAFGIGLDGRNAALRCAAGGLVGALFGTILYDLLGAMIAPLAQTGAPLSTSVAMRLLARGLVTVLATLGAAWAAGRPAQPTATIRS